MGRCLSTLTHHKKGIRAVVGHPTDFSFGTWGGGVRTWTGDGVFLNKGVSGIGGSGIGTTGGGGGMVNSMDCNVDGVLVTGGISTITQVRYNNTGTLQ